jgi:sarcosine oxidase subunit alpha
MTWNRFANRAAIAVARQLAGLGKLPDRVLPPFSAAREEQVDALVVGAGPAGLGAAEVLAGAGRHVLVAEQEPRVGGRLRCCLQLPGDPTLDWADGVSSAVTRAGGEVVLDATVLGLWTDGGPCAALLHQGPQPRLRLIRPRRLILATGTHAEPPAFEDSDLPGVLAARGLLVALAECGVVPGERAAVLGRGPEADAVAARLAAAGMQAVRVSGVPLRAVGRGRLDGVVMSGGARVECDTLAVATPRAPAAELARLVGAALTLDASGDAFHLSAGEGGRIAPGVYVAGEVLGAMDAAAAVESGRRSAETSQADTGTETETGRG